MDEVGLFWKQVLDKNCLMGEPPQSMFDKMEGEGSKFDKKGGRGSHDPALNEKPIRQPCR